MILVDPHVHLRDWNQKDAETIIHAIQVARRANISAFFEMPNTSPALTTLATVKRRIAEVDTTLQSLQLYTPPRFFHGIYMGLTKEKNQIQEVVHAHATLFPRVTGLKMYAGHSTGNMGIVRTQDQYAIWKILSSQKYRGVVAVHAEKETIMKSSPHSTTPDAHAHNRPPLAEITSVQTQINLAECAGFRGTLHICHVSAPETVDLIQAEKPCLPFTLSCGVTPHHALLDIEYAAQSHIPPTWFLVNPPLRFATQRAQLFEKLLAHKIDWIESDHAPHTKQHKEQGASGLPGLPAFRLLTDILKTRIPHTVWKSIVGAQVLETFGIELPPSMYVEDETIKQWDLAPDNHTSDQWTRFGDEYLFDPYEERIAEFYEKSR